MIAIEVIKESYNLLYQMAPYLFLGYLIGGALQVFLPKKRIEKHLGQKGIISVLKATFFGLPLPLCSCSVLPVAVSLKKSGASKGALSAFLVATPTNGVDSFLASFPLLGPIFAWFRLAASTLGAILVGLAVSLCDTKKVPPSSSTSSNSSCCCSKPPNGEKMSKLNKTPLTSLQIIYKIFYEAFFPLFKDSASPLLVGIILGGIISSLLPESLLHSIAGDNISSILVFFLLGIPLYVCSTGSLPIAASFLAKGLNPGAAFVFLFSGPLTNTISLVVIFKELGKKLGIIFLSVSFIVSFFFGITLNYFFEVLSPSSTAKELVHLSHDSSPLSWINNTTSLFLLTLIFYHVGKSILKKIKNKKK